jgi:hypothetical protein
VFSIPLIPKCRYLPYEDRADSFHKNDISCFCDLCLKKANVPHIFYLGRSFFDSDSKERLKEFIPNLTESGNSSDALYMDIQLGLGQGNYIRSFNQLMREVVKQLMAEYQCGTLSNVPPHSPVLLDLVRHANTTKELCLHVAILLLVIADTTSDSDEKSKCLSDFKKVTMGIPFTEDFIMEGLGGSDKLREAYRSHLKPSLQELKDL